MGGMTQGILDTLYLLSSIVALVGITKIDNKRNWFTRVVYEIVCALASVNVVIALVLSAASLIMGQW